MIYLDSVVAMNLPIKEILSEFSKAVIGIEKNAGRLSSGSSDELDTYLDNRRILENEINRRCADETNIDRKCKGCPTDIKHKHPNANFCTSKCKDKYWNRVNPRGYGVKSETDEHNEIMNVVESGWDAHKESM